MSVFGYAMALLGFGCFVFVGTKAMASSALGSSEDSSGMIAGLALVLVAIAFAAWVVMPESRQDSPSSTNVVATVS